MLHLKMGYHKKYDNYSDYLCSLDHIEIKLNDFKPNTIIAPAKEITSQYFQIKIYLKDVSHI